MSMNFLKKHTKVQQCENSQRWISQAFLPPTAFRRDVSSDIAVSDIYRTSFTELRKRSYRPVLIKAYEQWRFYHMAVQIIFSIQIKIIHYPIGFVHSTALHLKSHNPIIWSCLATMADIISTEKPLFSHLLNTELWAVCWCRLMFSRKSDGFDQFHSWNGQIC